MICDFEIDGEHTASIVNKNGQFTALVKKHLELNALDAKTLNQKLGE